MAVTCFEAPTDAVSFETLRTVVDMKHGEMSAGVFFGESKLSTAATAMNCAGTHRSAVKGGEAVVAQWFDLFSHSWRGGFSGKEHQCSFSDAVDSCGAMWHPSFKFVIPSFRQQELGNSHCLPKLNELFRPEGFLLEVPWESDCSFDRQSFLSSKLFIRGQVQGSRHRCGCFKTRLLMECSRLRRQLHFPGFVPNKVECELQDLQSGEEVAASAGQVNNTYDVAAASNHTSFGSWLAAHCKGGAGEARSGRETDLMDACASLIYDFETAVADLEFSAGTGFQGTI